MMTETLTLTTDMMLVLGILVLTILLFVTEVVRVDVAAMLIMVIVGLLGLIPTQELLNGFSSNAVIAIIAVMIMGAGLDKAGIMSKLAQFILKVSGQTEKRVLPMIFGTIAISSSFMQNVAAAALFLPVVNQISARTHIPLSRLLMPMGFGTLLGGTLTLVGCSSLIILNDLIISTNSALPPGVTPMQPFTLFAPTPIGLALVSVGLIYFLVAGRWILPSLKTLATRSITPVDYFRQRYGVEGKVFELLVTPNSPLSGKPILAYEEPLHHSAVIVALLKGKHLRISPARDVILEPGDGFAMIGDETAITEFAHQFHLLIRPQIGIFTEILIPTQAGVSEVVIPNNSQLIGYSLLDLRMRKTYGLTVLEAYRHHEVILKGLRDLVLQSGDTLLVHSTWEDLAALKDNKNFVTVTLHAQDKEQRTHKMGWAIGFLMLSLGLILFTETRLAIAFLIGALGMIISGVITIDEGYKRVSWQTVFLLAGLIPLGQAVEATGTAAWLAQQALNGIGEMPVWVLQTALAILATVFTQLMSNVGTTVLLVPLAVNIAIQSHADPAMFALTIALATSNSFMLPTHQVNALLMGPGGYRVADYLRAGSMMTILFLIVLITMINIVF